MVWPDGNGASRPALTAGVFGLTDGGVPRRCGSIASHLASLDPEGVKKMFAILLIIYGVREGKGGKGKHAFRFYVISSNACVIQKRPN